MIRSSIVKEYLIPVAALVAALLAVDPGQLIKNVTGYATPLSGYWWLAIAVLSPAFCAYFARAYLSRVRASASLGAAASPALAGSLPAAVYANRQENSYRKQLDDALGVAKTLDVIGIANNRLTSDVNVDFIAPCFLTGRARFA